MVIELRNISKSYKKRKAEIPVIDNFSYCFEDGKMYLIKGASGCGKTTLLTIIAMLQNPDMGEVIYDGKLVNDLNREEQCSIRRESVGIVYQDCNLFNGLSVLDNIIFVSEHMNKKGKKAYIEEANEYLYEFGISHRAKHKPQEISTGEQQRVGLIRAVFNRPKLLICDEPISNLNKENAEKIVSYINKYSHQKGNTAIITSHNDDFDEFADVIINLKTWKV